MSNKIQGKKLLCLTFKLGSSFYGIPVERVNNIVELSLIKMAQHANSNFIGHVKQRNAIVPVIDTRVKLNIDASEYTDNTCVIITEIKQSKGNYIIGLVVDLLHEVAEVEINKNAVGGVMDFENAESSYGKAFTIINPDKLFTLKELELLSL